MYECGKKEHLFPCQETLSCLNPGARGGPKAPVTVHKTASHLPGCLMDHCPRPTMTRIPESPPLLPLPRPCSLHVRSPRSAPCAPRHTDMGSQSMLGSLGAGLHWVAVAMLGSVMIVVVPSIIKLQVHKNVCIDPGSLSFSMWNVIPSPSTSPSSS